MLYIRHYITRKPCCRKETARCCKCSFRSKFASNIPYKYKTSHASKATLSTYSLAWSSETVTGAAIVYKNANTVVRVVSYSFYKKLSCSSWSIGLLAAD